MKHFLEALDRAAASDVAVVDDACAWTYDTLTQRARRIAARLRDQYGGGQFLLVPATSDAPFVATLLAVMYSGNTPIPIDPALPEAGRDYIREKSRAAGLVDHRAEADLDGCEPVDHRDDAIPAMVLFTSGTSGYPKGVIVSQANLLHSCTAVSGYLDYTRHRSAAVVLPLHYSYALLSQVCCMLFVGGRTRLFAEFRNPLKFAAAVDELRLETFCGVPSTYHALCLVHGMAPLSMPSVRVLCTAGAAMDRSKLTTIREIFPRATLFNNYGMTEAAPRIAYVRDDDPRFDSGTCGRPIEGVEVKIVDPETFRPLPDGHEGMLVVRGENITAGYLNDPELTREAFTDDGFLISGDVARLDHGYIFVAGRMDDIFNVGGEKVAPLEIEHVLNRHEAVELSAVRGLPDAQRGHAAAAFVKLRRPASRKELIAFLEHDLPAAKVPLRYFEVRDFPRTPNGKLRRRLLAPDGECVVRELGN